MYYRVAIQADSGPTRQWKSTILSSLESLFRFLLPLSTASLGLDDSAGEGASWRIAALVHTRGEQQESLTFTP